MRISLIVIITAFASVGLTAKVGDTVLVINCVNGSAVENPSAYVDEIRNNWIKETEIAGIIIEKISASALAQAFFKGRFKAAIRGTQSGVVDKTSDSEPVTEFFFGNPKKQGCFVFQGTLKDFPIDNQ